MSTKQRFIAMAITVGFAVAILCSVLAIVSLPTGQNGSSQVLTPEPRVTQTYAATPNDPFSLILPDGWHNSGCESEYDAAHSWCFSNDGGQHFVVNIDPEGTGFIADQVTRVAIDGKGIRVVGQDMCPKGEELCSAGDDRMDEYVFYEKGGSIPLAGHSYYFVFVNTVEEKTTADLQFFLDSFRAT